VLNLLFYYIHLASSKKTYGFMEREIEHSIQQIITKLKLRVQEIELITAGGWCTI
jgi:hypothetical protein